MRIDSKVEEYTLLNMNEDKRRGYSLDLEKKLTKTKNDLDEYRTTADGLGRQHWESKPTFEQNLPRE